MNPDSKTPAYNGNDNGVVTQQPPANTAQPAYKKYQEKTGSQEWLNDKWDCFEGPDNLCLKATFCPCFVYGKTQARMRDPSLAGYERFNPDCLMWGGANYCGLGWVFNFIRRGEIRTMYDIRGDTFTDCLFSWCCHCCALIQQEKEIIGRNAMGANTTGYAAPGGMNAQPMH